MTSNVLRHNARISAVLDLDPEKVLRFIKLQQGMEEWLRDESRSHKLESLGGEMSHDGWRQLHRALFWSGKSRLAIYFMTRETKHINAIPMHSEINAPLIHALNRLVDDGWKVNAQLAFEDPRRVRGGLILRPAGTSVGSATKDSVKINIGWKRDRHGYSDRPVLQFIVMCKIGSSKHYRVCDDTKNIDKALKLANKEVHRIKHGMVEMPEAHTFSHESYKVSKPLIDVGGGLKAYTVSVMNIIRQVSVCGVVSLQPDGTFSLDAYDPNNDDVWVLVVIDTSMGYRYLLAVNGDNYHFLSGKKYLRLDTLKTLKLTHGDRELINKAVSEWINLS